MMLARRRIDPRKNSSAKSLPPRVYIACARARKRYHLARSYIVSHMLYSFSRRLQTLQQAGTRSLSLSLSLSLSCSSSLLITQAAIGARPAVPLTLGHEIR